jgi:hypothetical protein
MRFNGSIATSVRGMSRSCCERRMAGPDMPQKQDGHFEGAQFRSQPTRSQVGTALDFDSNRTFECFSRTWRSCGKRSGDGPSFCTAIRLPGSERPGRYAIRISRVLRFLRTNWAGKRHSRSGGSAAGFESAGRAGGTGLADRIAQCKARRSGCLNRGYGDCIGSRSGRAPPTAICATFWKSAAAGGRCNPQK